MQLFIGKINGITCFGVAQNGVCVPLLLVSDVVEFRDAVIKSCDEYLEAKGAKVPKVFEDAFNRHLEVKDLMVDGSGRR